MGQYDYYMHFQRETGQDAGGTMGGKYQPVVLIAQRLESKKADRFLIGAVGSGLIDVHCVRVGEVGIELEEGIFGDGG